MVQLHRGTIDRHDATKLHSDCSELLFFYECYVVSVHRHYGCMDTGSFNLCVELADMHAV